MPPPESQVRFLVPTRKDRPKEKYMDEFPQFEIRPARHVLPEEDPDNLVEVVMWYNHNQANVLRMTRPELEHLTKKLQGYLWPMNHPAS